MTTKFGFTLMSIQEFETWIDARQLARTVLTIQEHHTYSPAYTQFNGSNHFALQQGMKNYHVNANGWSDIGQHFTTFPDGTIMTGRSLEKSPACVVGQNANAICIENLGNFDSGKDAMTPAHRDTIIRITAKLCKRFRLPVNTNSIVYHHWFDLSTGERNNGTKNNKTCPGTSFFGGNKVADCVANFLPLVTQAGAPAAPVISASAVLKYVSVTASSLNIRTKPNASSPKATDRDAAALGAILRVYKETNGWYKISGSQEHWVLGKYTTDVKRATVKADTLNARSGPGTTFQKLGSYTKGQELFIVKEQNGWCKVNMDDRWVSKDYLVFA
ncbi:SH3 domain-containing protein [Mucilaginibacter sp. 14171R-50]|uniref:SH3 domain-containing protein n=1 Tax=Mucilaginibacter sp. 14171R-50 TaxID=2703789 RepID=UPI00138BDCD8|nr:SH3 domain-containing protein [Mucilaginibacter sp. 14171R-50]QHS57058.1 SH3 domain-containing protein [Mucilaginibacter sp. 14171R-50]